MRACVEEMPSHDALNRHTPASTHVDDTNTFEMDDMLDGNDTEQVQPQNDKEVLAGVARHTLGLILLLCVVFLWTACNFLGSSIFADNTYAKPLFLTYLNSSCFTLCVIPRLLSTACQNQRNGTLAQTLRSTFTLRTLKSVMRRHGSQHQYTLIDEEDPFHKPNNNNNNRPAERPAAAEESLDLLSTARFSLGFCMFWFAANYFALACLQYTTVASTTILTSTSSVWTLIFGTIMKMEKFTWRKLCGVLASLGGIVLISQLDLKATDAEVRPVKRAIDEFPEKTPYELIFGDSLALFSAVIYGFYTIVLKKTTVLALPKTIHMPTLFGFVGIFNMVIFLPVFPILHFTGIEPFVLPPTSHIWTILLFNSASSLLSDICWAYAMVFTSPLVVTVGLSLTIPLSLVGEMIIQGRFESWLYWVGAMIVVGSFVFVEREEKHEEDGDGQAGIEDIGEPGPAILVEDYDEILVETEGRRSSPVLLMDDNDDDNGSGSASRSRGRGYQ